MYNLEKVVNHEMLLLFHCRNLRNLICLYLADMFLKNTGRMVEIQKKKMSQVRTFL